MAEGLVPGCSECGNDDGPYDGLCLDCRMASHHDVAVASVVEAEPRDNDGAPPRWAEVVAP